MRTKTLSLVIAIFLCAGISALAALDLQFTTAITQTPDPANTGNTVTFKVTFKTVGGAVDSLKIIGVIDGSKIFERTYAHINANLPRTDSFTWTAAAGSHTAWFELDPGKTAGDSNYGNNRVEKAFTISAPTTTFFYKPEMEIDWSRLPELKPDLTIESVQITPDVLKVNDISTFKLIVKNIGMGVAKSNSLKIEIRHCIGKQCNAFYEVESQIPEIAPKGIYEVTGSALVSKSGTSHIISTADYRSSIIEMKENNNSIWKNFYVKPQFIK